MGQNIFQIFVGLLIIAVSVLGLDETTLTWVFSIAGIAVVIFGILNLVNESSV
jgi:hypothetical protein